MPIRLLTFCLLQAILVSLASAQAPSSTNIHVDPVNGNDANDGRSAPVKTIKRGIKLAQPGDTVHLATALYHESADLSSKKGLPDKPIILDGHGAVLDGSEPVRAADWEALGNGFYRKVKLMPHMEDKGNRDMVIMRWFFLWNGEMNHMGRTSKGHKPPFKKPADLQVDEWTYVQDEDAFYIRIAPEKNLDAAHIRYPARSSGVIESGGGQHLIVRNTISTHVYNDGYNIHGSERDCVFEHIASIECGDDGFSAHEDAECRIDGFVSIGNSTGLCDTVSSSTHYKNVYIAHCLGFDVYFIGDADHSIENGLVSSSASSACSIGQQTSRPEGPFCTVTFKNVLFERAGGPQDIHVSRGGKLTAERCTFVNLNIRIASGGEMDSRLCFFAAGANYVGGGPRGVSQPVCDLILAPHARWLSDENNFRFGSLHLDKASFTRETFKEFQRLTGSDKDTWWDSEPRDESQRCADETSLQGVKKTADETLKQFAKLDPKG